MKHRILGLLLAAAMTPAADAQGGFKGPGRYQIANLKSGKALELDRGDQTTVIQFSPRQTDGQRWDIEPAGPGLYFIRNAMNGKALEAPQNSNSAPVVCGRFDGNPNQQWRLTPGKDGNALITSHGGRTLDVPDGSSRDRVHVQIYDSNGDSNQRFILQRVMRERSNDHGPDREGDRGGLRLEANPSHSPDPDPMGRYWDEREQTWKLAGDGVCFYRQTDFRGEALCTRVGVDISELAPESGGRFRSARLFGRAQVVEVFESAGFRGERARLSRDERNLDRLGERIGSVRVN